MTNIKDTNAMNFTAFLQNHDKYNQNQNKCIHKFKFNFMSLDNIQMQLETRLIKTKLYCTDQKQQIEKNTISVTTNSEKNKINQHKKIKKTTKHKIQHKDQVGINANQHVAHQKNTKNTKIHTNKSST